MFDFEKDEEGVYEPHFKIKDVTDTNIQIEWEINEIYGNMVNNFLFCENGKRAILFPLIGNCGEITNLSPETEYRIGIQSVISPSNFQMQRICMSQIINIRTGAIEDFYQNKSITSEVLQYNIDKVWSISPQYKITIDYMVQKFEEQFKTRIPLSLKFVVFGSVESGFGMKKSDVDICVLIEEPNNFQTEEVLMMLIDKVINPLRRDNFITKYLFIRNTRIPIIKISYSLFHHNLKIDLSYNNNKAVKNTEFLKKCSKIPLLYQLGMTFKHWSKTCGFGEVVNGGISSYGIIIMTLFYLKKIDQVSFVGEELFIIPTFSKKSLIELWKGLLLFYFRFDYENFVIDIVKIENKTERQTPVVVLDPFEDFNLARRISYETLERIKNCFKATIDLLEGKKINNKENAGVVDWFKNLKHPSETFSERRGKGRGRRY